MRQAIEWYTPILLNKMKKTVTYIIIIFSLISCGSTRLTTTSIGYQSVRTVHAQPSETNPIPADADIAVAYTISENGEITAIVYNRSDEIMTIDQTKSFFISPNGVSTSYYDPTIKQHSTTNITSTTEGSSVNLGAIAGAIGVGGVLRQIANGINVGSSETTGVSTTNTTYIADLPQVSIAPRSSGAMSKVFNIAGIGKNSLNGPAITLLNLSEKQSYSKFSICISYSIDGGKTFDKIVTDFYANSKIIVPVTDNRAVNDALRKIYQEKPDAINEYWWLLYFNTNVSIGYESRVQGILFDYK